MKEYRKVAKFKFKNNKYIMYLDNNNKHFFLKTDDQNNLSYITINELLELTKQFTEAPLIMNAQIDNHEIVKLIPKVIKGGIAVTLSLTLLTGCIPTFNQTTSNHKESKALKENIALGYISIDQEIENNLGYKYDEKTNTIYIYDMDYLNIAFKDTKITLDDLNNAIDNNHLHEFCYNVTSKYPNIELRVLYENLQTLEVLECDKEELTKITKNTQTTGSYDVTENKIYIS